MLRIYPTCEYNPGLVSKGTCWDCDKFDECSSYKQLDCTCAQKDYLILRQKENDNGRK